MLQDPQKTILGVEDSQSAAVLKSPFHTPIQPSSQIRESRLSSQFSQMTNCGRNQNLAQILKFYFICNCHQDKELLET